MPYCMGELPYDKQKDFQLFEKDFNSDYGPHAFVAAFAQANAGDVSPNPYGHEGGAGAAGRIATEKAGKPQYDRARQLFETVLSTHAASAPAHFYVGYLALKSGDELSAAREFARAQALPVAAAVAGASNEGDTKGDAPMRARGQHCDALRALTEERAQGDTQRSMRERYRRLDSLLTAARARVH